MKFETYLKEGKLSEEQWQKKFDKINRDYYKAFKSTIIKMINSREGNNYYYNSWDDIIGTAADNVPIKHVNDQFNTKFLSDYESSLEALLSEEKYK